MFYLQEVSMSPWQWIYLVSIVLSGLMLAGVITLDSIPRSKITRLPLVLLIPLVIGMLYLLAFPFNFYAFLELQIVMGEFGAPLGAVMISTMFGVLCWFLGFTSVIRMKSLA